jgi:hypothetical protein
LNFYAAFFGGTLAPSRRALERPIAMACARFLCSPCFRWRISVATSCCAFGPYFLPRELRLEAAPRRDGEEVRDEPLARAEDRLELDFFFAGALDFLADDFFAEDFLAAVLRPAERLPEDFLAAVRRLDDFLLALFLELDFLIAIRTSPLKLCTFVYAHALLFRSR